MWCDCQIFVCDILNDFKREGGRDFGCGGGLNYDCGNGLDFGYGEIECYGFEY